ncbi:hypothetical protein [Streptomyces endophyticus]|uniref:DUF3040 domain-containing protein n=1 Tax=Streptomyces endophyticus TaxID=714166 RepID=A0ABU6FNG7_9ACTN|nr:hypothetical protein [Streptomyces endophyticus]MEB8344337.1 hypothetical protein [Streptomyces endophyticus]
MERQWPEGASADPGAARARYNADMRASRKAVREVLNVEMPIAHMGLAIVVIATAFAAMLWSLRAGLVLAGGFAALFLVALAVALLRGRRSWSAVRTAYKFTFGWANWAWA